VTFEGRAGVQVEPVHRRDQLRGGGLERLEGLGAEDSQQGDLNFGMGRLGAGSRDERSHARGDSRQEVVEWLDRRGGARRNCSGAASPARVSTPSSASTWV